MSENPTEVETEDTEETGYDGRSFRVEGNDLSDYVGTSPEYQNYADETHKPSRGEEGSAEAEVQTQQQDTDDANAYVVSAPPLVSPAANSHSHADPLNFVAETPDDIVETGVQATTVANANDGTTLVADTESDNEDGTVDLGVQNSNVPDDQGPDLGALSSGDTTSIQDTEHGEDGVRE